MDNVLQRFKNMAGKVGNWLDNTINIFDSDDPLIILPYRGYANDKRLFIKGRVLENENIFDGKSESEIQNIINSFKRFETDEVPDAVVELKINNQTFEVTTDEEGYFTLDTLWNAPAKASENRWHNITLTLLEARDKKPSSITSIGQIYLPSRNSDYGIITDVDDTVLQTHVSSMFRLKMLYATFLQDGHQRLPMEGIVDLFKAFVKGGDGQRENPIFYVSSSPWNLYDLLAEFMEVQHLPKGPILLRDYGLNPSGAFSDHKITTISHILNTYPELPFVMLGDTAHKDADFYIDLARKFPDRIKAIYIRQTRDTENARRIARLIEANSDIDAILVHSSKEMTEHATHKGLLYFGEKK